MLSPIHPLNHFSIHLSIHFFIHLFLCLSMCIKEFLCVGLEKYFWALVFLGVNFDMGSSRCNYKHQSSYVSKLIILLMWMGFHFCMLATLQFAIWRVHPLEKASNFVRDKFAGMFGEFVLCYLPLSDKALVGKTLQKKLSDCRLE